MEKIIIQKVNSGERVDKFLKKEFFSDGKITRGEIIRQIKEGNILINSKKVKPSYILKEKDSLDVDFKKNFQGIIPNENIKLKIIYQNEDMIIIDKPAGIQVHPGQSEKKETLVNGLVWKFPEITTVGDAPELRPGIVHRLDKETSGVMVVAKNQRAFDEMKRKFKNHEIKKTYWAIVAGNFASQEKSGIIEKSLAKSSDYKRQVVAGKKTKTKIRPAITEYEVIKEFSGYSLVEARPKTGRMHQIRVHLFSIGHPVLGDKLYAPKGKKDDLFPKRQLLHAKKIEFDLFGKKYVFESELPSDFDSFLD